MSQLLCTPSYLCVFGHTIPSTVKLNLLVFLEKSNFFFKTWFSHHFRKLSLNIFFSCAAFTYFDQGNNYALPKFLVSELLSGKVVFLIYVIFSILHIFRFLMFLDWINWMNAYADVIIVHYPFVWKGISINTSFQF